MVGYLISALVALPVSIDSQLLNGTWKIVKAEGEDLPKRELLVTFQNGKVRLREDGPLQPFRINPLAKPKWIDIQLEDDAEFPGIYELEGDRLKIYLITESIGKRIPPRPKNFKEKCAGQLVYLERVKKK